ncbi:MAG: hypothetical protein WBG20_08305, partial [Candidatus Deferrimicrobiaceae bacterium]
FIFPQEGAFDNGCSRGFLSGGPWIRRQKKIFTLNEYISCFDHPRSRLKVIVTLPTRRRAT